MTLRFLEGTSLWPTLDAMLAKAPGVRQVATAYLGQGSHGRFPLRRGDMLLTSLSVRHAAQGLVSPADLRAYRKDGVRLYRLESLHGKLYLLGATAVVGSPNVSSHSTRLDETALATKDPAILADVRAWFAARCKQEIPDAFLDLCAAAWRPPAYPLGGAAPLGPRRDPDDPPDSDRTYLLRLTADLPDQTSAYDRVKQALKRTAARRKLPKTHGVQDWFYWRGGPGIGLTLAPGDTIVPVWAEDGKERVYACYTVLSTAPSMSDRGAPLTIVWYATQQDEVGIPWTTFRRRAASRGVMLANRFRSGRIRAPADAAVLRELATSR